MLRRVVRFECKLCASDRQNVFFRAETHTKCAGESARRFHYISNNLRAKYLISQSSPSWAKSLMRTSVAFLTKHFQLAGRLHGLFE